MAHSLRFIDVVASVCAATVLVWYGLDVHMRELYRPAVTTLAAANLAAFVVLSERLHIYIARRTEDLWGEILAVGEAGLYSGCIAVAVTDIWGGGLPNYSYLQALGASLLVLLGMRLAMRFTIRRLRRHGDDYRVWLIVGHNDRSAGIAEAIADNPHFGIRIAEIIDIDDGSGAASPERSKFASHLPPGVKLSVAKSVEEIRDIVATGVIDEVAVTLPMRTHYDTVSKILAICCDAGISVRIRPQAFEVLGFSTDVSHVGRIAMLTHFNGPSNYVQLTIKRVIDVLGSALGLLLLSPFLIVIAVAIKLGSPGPVFFRQTRVGLHGRHFEMIKFRSMVKDAHTQRESLAAVNERDGTAFKIRNDSRITPLGRWLRKYHLDEMPQLWNVLVGDMSLVGPRPLPVSEAFGSEWWQRRRLSMPPGLTCFWQLDDDAMMMPFKQWMELDMRYIDCWSLWLDLQLIARTFAALPRGRGW